MKHELKTDSAVFQSTWDGMKTFEVRKNDRDFHINDTLQLKETVHSGEEMANGLPLEYTGREITQLVNYILPGPIYGILDNWVVMTVGTIEFNEDLV